MDRVRRIVVSDTSPILALQQVGLVELISDMVDEVLVPPAVARELLAPPRGLKGVAIAEYAKFREIAPSNTVMIRQLSQELDSGESEAIALALECKVSALLIDEDSGRRVAKRFGLQPVGVLGILSTARRAGLIPAVGPIVNALRAKHGFFLANAVVDAVLRDLGEIA